MVNHCCQAVFVRFGQYPGGHSVYIFIDASNDLPDTDQGLVKAQLRHMGFVLIDEFDGLRLKLIIFRVRGAVFRVIGFRNIFAPW